MSKLYEKYCVLKSENKNIVYLFKCGIFFIFIEEDADKLSKIANLKLIPLNDKILKCGFPVSKLSKYIEILNNHNLVFKIIDDNFENISTVENYLLDLNILGMFNKIRNLDIKKATPMMCFNIVLDFQRIIKEGVIYGEKDKRS